MATNVPSGGDVDGVESCACWEEGVHENSLYFPLSITVNLKLL